MQSLGAGWLASLSAFRGQLASGSCHDDGCWQGRASLLSALALGGVMAAGLAMPAPAEAAPKVTSVYLYARCNLYGWGDNYCPFPYELSGFTIYVDFRGGGGGYIDISYRFSYDGNRIAFRPGDASLMCGLRAPGSPPACPTVTPGVGTLPLLGTSDTYAVDQTGLSISHDSSQSSVTLSFAGTAAASSGQEQIFALLGFDLLEPLNPGATVTYSETQLADATFTTLDFSCRDSTGTSIDCASDHPALSLRLNNPPPPSVPAPLALGALPALLVHSRQIRRRLRRPAPL